MISKLQLVGAGADKNKLNNMGWTPMYEAAHSGNIEVVTWLAAQGAAGAQEVDALTASRAAPVTAPASDNQADAEPPAAAVVTLQEEEEWEEEIVYKPRALGASK